MSTRGVDGSQIRFLWPTAEAAHTLVFFTPMPKVEPGSRPGFVQCFCGERADIPKGQFAVTCHSCRRRYGFDRSFDHLIIALPGGLS